MAYSTQNMYQMFDIIPNFVRKMFPFSLKSYPSCTNTMAWDIRDEIRSAYILRMVHQRVRALLQSHLLCFLLFLFTISFVIQCLFVTIYFWSHCVSRFFSLFSSYFHEDQICIVKMKNWGIMLRIHFD